MGQEDIGQHTHEPVLVFDLEGFWFTHIEDDFWRLVYWCLNSFMAHPYLI